MRDAETTTCSMSSWAKAAPVTASESAITDEVVSNLDLYMYSPFLDRPKPACFAWRYLPALRRPWSHFDFVIPAFLTSAVLFVLLTAAVWSKE
jgi:hypothetical protein